MKSTKHSFSHTGGVEAAASFGATAGAGNIPACARARSPRKMRRAGTHARTKFTFTHRRSRSRCAPRANSERARRGARRRLPLSLAHTPFLCPHARRVCVCAHRGAERQGQHTLFTCLYIDTHPCGVTRGDRRSQSFSVLQSTRKQCHKQQPIAPQPSSSSIQSAPARALPLKPLIVAIVSSHCGRPGCPQSSKSFVPAKLAGLTYAASLDQSGTLQRRQPECGARSRNGWND